MTVRGTAIGTSSSTTVSVVIPATTQGQDRMVLFVGAGWNPVNPAGWTQLDLASGVYVNRLVSTKAASGTAGSTSPEAGTTLSVTISGGSYDVVAALVVYVGEQRLRAGASAYANLANSSSTTVVSHDANDTLTYFGLARSNQTGTTCTSSQGSADQTATTTNFGACLAHEAGNVGSVTVTETSNKSGSSTYGTLLSVVSATPAQTAVGWEAQALADSPLAIWGLGEDFGTVAWTATSQPGVYAGSPTMGLLGILGPDMDTSISLNGSSQYATVAQGSWMDSATYTVEAWVRPTSLAHTLMIAAQDSGSGTNRRYQFLVNTNGSIAATAYIGSTGYTATSSAGVIATGTTYHAAWTFDGSNVRVFVNGTQVAITAASGSLNTTTVTTPLYIGGYISAGSYWAGQMEKVAIYGSALSQVRLAAHSAAGDSSLVHSRLIDTFVEVAHPAIRSTMRLAGTAAEVLTVSRHPRLAAVAAEVLTLSRGQTRLPATYVEVATLADPVAIDLGEAGVAVAAHAADLTLGVAKVRADLTPAWCTATATPATLTTVDSRVVVEVGAAWIMPSAQRLLVAVGDARPGTSGKPIPITGPGGTSDVDTVGTGGSVWYTYTAAVDGTVTLTATTTPADIFALGEYESDQVTPIRRVVYVPAAMEGDYWWMYPAAFDADVVEIFHDVTPTLSVGITAGSAHYLKVETVAPLQPALTLAWTAVATTTAITLTPAVTTALRCPAAVVVTVAGARSGDVVTVEVVGVAITAQSTVIGTNGSAVVTIALPATLGAGTYTIRVTDPDGRTADSTLKVAEDPTEVVTPVPPGDGPDGGDSTVAVRRWILKDPLAGGLGSYTVPINPEKMTSPHAPREVTIEYTTARSGQAHIWEGAARGHQWSFSGTTMTQAHYETLRMFAALQRRFWLTDHRGRAWVVSFQSVDFKPVGHPPLDWVWEYTIQATIFAGPVQPG